MNSELQSRQGVFYALGAFGLWGLAPIYFKAVSTVTPTEVLAHRVIWSVIFLLLLVTYNKQWDSLKAVVRNRQTILRLFFSASLISINWLVFIWAVSVGRIVETSLGYYINPLISVLLAMIFLGERLRPIQWIAISVACLGVINQIALVGSLPIVALTLAFSFGFYGLLRKKVSVNPVIGLTIETLLLLPFAMAYLLWLSAKDQLAFLHLSGTIDLLLIAAGLVTSLPLIFFAAATNRLSLTTLGLVQYVAPSLTFLLAVLIYNEPFGPPQLITFGCIWGALVIFTTEGMAYQKRKRII
ncbi:EamA family transporter RarD [Alkalimarinus coralli]|uniref:EamA family transporter RarD n=1 Tax=Alkalimarinus coralli TaxID=2935863 RepID=UPI00202B12AC|nr:EamA family transporter RarD [Alkalimarinus coralli]